MNGLHEVISRRVDEGPNKPVERCIIIGPDDNDTVFLTQKKTVICILYCHVVSIRYGVHNPLQNKRRSVYCLERKFESS